MSKAVAMLLAHTGGQGLEWGVLYKVIIRALELSGSADDHAGLTSLG